MDRNRWADEMGKRSEARRTEWSGTIVASWVLAALAGAWLIPAHAAADGKDSDREAAAQQAPRHHGESSLDARVRMLSKALDLDATQQSELRRVLEGQRERVMRVWNDTSLPAVYRISATQAISDNTADQIRALLNDEQKKKYNPPRQPHEASGSDRPSVEALMNALKPK
jgi:hypothetical protein